VGFKKILKNFSSPPGPPNFSPEFQTPIGRTLEKIDIPLKKPDTTFKKTASYISVILIAIQQLEKLCYERI